MLIYLGIIVLTLDSLLSGFSTSLPGPGRTNDYAIFYWDLWWLKHALLELKTDPFLTDIIIYPSTHNLVTHTLAPFWGLLSIPLQGSFGLITIFNLFVALSFFLTAYLTFLFVYRKGVAVSIAALAGGVVAFTPAMVQRAIDGHLNLLPMWWIPLTLLLFDRLVEKGSWATARSRFGFAVLLTLTVYAALLTDFQYLMWLPLLLLPYALYRFLLQDKAQRKQLLMTLSLSLALFLLLAYLYPIRYLLNLPPDHYPQATVETAHAYSFPLTALIEAGEADLTMGRLLLPLVILTAVIGGIRAERWLWLLLGLGTFVLALGPYLVLPDERRLSLPYLFIHTILNGYYRTPVRFAVLTVFSLAVFGALAAQEAANRFKRRPTTITLATLLIGLMFIFDYRLQRPFPTFSLPQYDTYAHIAEDKETRTLLEVPLGVFTGYTIFGHGHELVFYQTIHHKPILNGALARMPLTAVELYKSYNLLNAIAGREPLAAHAPAELNALIQEWAIAYILIHLDLLREEERETLPPFFSAHPSLCFWQQEGALLAYRIRPQDGCETVNQVDVDVGSAADLAHIGPGWYLPEDIGGVNGRWAGAAPEATLRFDLEPQAYTLTFEAVAFPANQMLTIKVNERIIDSFALANGWQIYEVVIPKAAIPPDEPTILTLTHSQWQSANEQTGGTSPDTRPLAAAYNWFTFSKNRLSHLSD
jgi:hypothetical protein